MRQRSLGVFSKLMRRLQHKLQGPSRSNRFRTEQVDAAVRLAPFSVVSSAATILVVVASFWPHGHHRYLCALFIAIEGVVAAILFGCRQWQAGMPRSSASPAAFNFAVAGAGLLGVLWGSMPVLLFASASVHSQLLVTGTVTGLICTGLVVATIPTAALGFMLPIIAGSFIALAETGNTFFLFMGTLLSFYGIFVCASVIYLFRLFKERLMGQLQMEEQAETIRLLLWDFERTASDWLWQTDAKGRLCGVSERFASAINIACEDLEDTFFLETLLLVQGGAGAAPEAAVLEELSRCMEASEHFRNCVVQGLVNGKRHWWSFTGAPVFGENSEFLGYRGVGSDVTAGKESEERIAYLATHDSLTGLPNRTSLHESLMQAFEGLKKDSRRFALLCLDLDGFKAVNDTYGHPMGDALLRAVAGRLRNCVRDGDKIARMGGDEFAVLHLDGNAVSAGALAQRIIEHLSAPYHINKVEIAVSTSIGVALAPENGMQLEQLIENGDQALYEAKLAGRRVFRICKGAPST